MVEFRIIDVKTEDTDPNPKVVQARTPEQAAELALGLALVRSGARQNLRARVYYQHAGEPTNMVRLYMRLGDQAKKGHGNVR